MSKGGSRLFEYTAGAKAALVSELVASGEKCTPSKIIGITRDPSGKIIWLEEGNSKSGMKHISNRHLSEFNKQGVSAKELSTYIMEAITQGNIVGRQGTRSVYEFKYEGKLHRIAIEIGSNGYVVSANPKSMKGIK